MGSQSLLRVDMRAVAAVTVNLAHGECRGSLGCARDRLFDLVLLRERRRTGAQDDNLLFGFYFYCHAEPPLAEASRRSDGGKTGGRKGGRLQAGALSYSFTAKDCL